MEQRMIFISVRTRHSLPMTISTAIHKLWLDITHEKGCQDAHHKEIVTLALARLTEAVQGDERRSVIEQIQELMRQRSQAERAEDEEET